MWEVHNYVLMTVCHVGALEQLGTVGGSYPIQEL